MAKITFTKEKPNLKGRWHWHNDEESSIAYQIRNINYGILGIEFLKNNDNKAINGLYICTDPENVTLDKEYVLSHLVQNGYGFKWGFDIKQVNLNHIFSKIINDEDVKLEINLGEYTSHLYCNAKPFRFGSEIKNDDFRDINHFKSYLAEIKPELELVAGSYKLITSTYEKIKPLLACNFSTLSYHTLKSSLTFCKTYDHELVLKIYHELLDNRDDYFRYIDLCDKISNGTRKTKFNLTIRGIKFSFNGNVKYICADVPFLSLLPQNVNNHAVFIIAYLKSINEFNNLTYRLENVMFADL